MTTDPTRLFAEAQALHQAGRLAEARARYQQVLALSPRHGGALHMLGLMAFQVGQADLAVTLLGQAARADPDVPALHSNLGLALAAAGRLPEAAARFRHALALNGRLAEAHAGLGDALWALGKLEAAEESHRNALMLRPGHAGTLAALASLALARGDGPQALVRIRQALAADESPRLRRLFAEIAQALRFDQDDAEARALLTRAIAEGWGRPAALAPAAVSLVRQRQAAGGRLEEDALLRALLVTAPVCDVALEKALTAARRGLLTAAQAGAVIDTAFAGALARQCFLNGYVFWQAPEEEAQAAALAARGMAELSEAQLLALACYKPLGEIDGIAAVAAESDALAAVLRQQRDEPAEERRLAAALPVLTPVPANGEDRPYPRWTVLPVAAEPLPLSAYLAGRFPLAPRQSLRERPDVLVAGCGTGQAALELARTFRLGGITAIDLSRASLAFAARKAAEAGIETIRFGQGDILQAAALGRRFGLIECGGVLHQLADPLAGWAALLAVLAPDGLMRVAVHSAVARQALAAIARPFAAGRAATPETIRACRKALMEDGGAALAPILEAPVFFSLDGCRHLLFPGAEHPLGFAAIAAFLRAKGLVLLGLEVEPQVAAAYRARFPGDPAATDLDNWAAFEQDRPHTFAAMIQFWVQKRG